MDKIETVPAPRIGQIISIGQRSRIEWEIRSILGNVIVCKRADVEGEPTSHLQILSMTQSDYQAIMKNKPDKALKMKAHAWGYLDGFPVAAS